MSTGFSKDQQSYLQGFTLGADVARIVHGLPVLSGSAAGNVATVKIGPNGVTAVGGIGMSPPADSPPAGPERIHFEAQSRVLAEGRKLCPEEKAKREKNALDMWDEMRRKADAGEFPKGTDVLLYKFHGLFYVAPAQDAFMCRLRIPGGAINSHQFRGIADLAEAYGGGYTDATTRANLQIREIGPRDALHVVTGLQELGIVSRGSGADNIRNVTATPTSGFDTLELIETLPLAKEIHHYILNHREMYGLPRKFNIAVDGGGAISSLEDTNDIGFTAVRVSADNATDDVPAGVYFQLCLGGITGHKDFARPTGVLVKPSECAEVSGAIVRVFVANGDRTDRKKARLKYVLDDWGFDKFLAETEKELKFKLRRFPLERCEPRPPEDRQAHVGFHRQKQDGLHYVGVVLPVGRITCEQMRGLAQIAERYGRGEFRLTVWQNLLIPHIPAEKIEAVQQALEAIGLDWRATSIRSGLVACTGNAGCKFASSDTKDQAMILANYLDERIELDQPVNIHLTGCHHSCAQHYIGDIGMLATQVDVNDELVEGYHIYVGGGWGEQRGMGRELRASVPFDEIPPLVERVLLAYLELRDGALESFASFTRRHTIAQLQEMIEQPSLV